MKSKKVVKNSVCFYTGGSPGRSTHCRYGGGGTLSVKKQQKKNKKDMAWSILVVGYIHIQIYKYISTCIFYSYFLITNIGVGVSGEYMSDLLPTLPHAAERPYYRLPATFPFGKLF